MNDWRGARVLVTGVGGFLGTYVARRLHELGARVVGLGPAPRGSGPFAPELPPELEAWTGTTRDAGLLSRLLAKHAIDVCFHFGSVSQLRCAVEAPVATFEDNIQGTWVLLEACRQRPRPVALLLASSDKVYGDQGGVPCAEEAPLLADSPYDASKACADLLARTYARQYALPVVVMRFANIYGPGDPNLERLIPNTIRRLVDGAPPMIHAGADAFVRELLFVEDAFAAMQLLAGRADALRGQAFNVGSGETRTVAEVIARLDVLLGGRGAVEVAPVRAHAEIPRQAIDSRRLRALGWRPSVTLDDGLARTIAWYRARLERSRGA